VSTTVQGVFTYCRVERPWSRYDWNVFNPALFQCLTWHTLHRMGGAELGLDIGLCVWIKYRVFTQSRVKWVEVKI
jgi:hypothetical protein